MPRVELLVLMLLLLLAASCAMQSGVGRGGRALRADAPEVVRYTVTLGAPQTQNVEVSMTVPAAAGPALEVALPVWRPGRYAVLDPAGTVSGVRARDSQGRSLAIEKTDKTTWRVALTGTTDVTVSYTVYANSLVDRTRHVDDTHAFLSPATVLMYSPSRRGSPVSVKVNAPAGWQTATGLEEAAGSPGTFLAPDYDILVDSPLEIGLQERADFDVDGVPHRIAVWTGRSASGPALPIDLQKWSTDFARIVRVQREIFGDLPYERFVFLIHLAAGGGGGTEHFNSFIAQASPRVVEDEKAYHDFLALIAHEMFHTWNIKRLRPADLTPYDYAHENYTKLLWVVEGTTSYYDDLCLVRAGITPERDYLNMVAGMIGADRDRPGAAVQSVEESSFDAWIKFNRPNPDAVNTTVSFYTKGALVSLYLDLELRRRTGGRVSMDDLMRDLYRRYPVGSAGYTTADVLASLRELSGTDFGEAVRAHIGGTAPPPFEEAFAGVGLQLVYEKDESVPADTRAYLGMDLADRAGRAVVTALRSDGPAYRSGLIVDDEVVALNGLRLPAGELAARLKKRAPGDSVRVTYFRREELRETTIQLAGKPAGTWKLKKVDSPTEAQKASYRTWLGVKD